MTIDTSALAALFAAGPDNFIGERLAQYLAITQPEAASQARDDDKDEPADEAEEEEEGADEDEDEDEEDGDGDEAAPTGPQNPDAWQAEATQRVASLWSGDPDDVETNWGVPPPPELAAFWKLTRGYNMWSSFTELRLDASLLGRFDDDENVFELCVLSDQLNYLGTALSEAFSGAVCFATYGDGDSWHIDLNPTDEEDPHHVVTRYSHDDHAFEQEPVANSLHHAVYLAAVVHAFRQEWLTQEQAKTLLASLHGKVAPSWHFSIDDIDGDFVSSDAPSAATAAYMAARSLWIFKVLGSDKVGGLEAVPRQFFPKLNVPMTPTLTSAPAEVASNTLFAGRIKSVERLVPTALYAMWRAYLFDEPELEQYLALGRVHRGRLARDAARLIDELRAGREVLGKHTNWSQRLAKFRALDLDPRRAAEREAEAAAAAERSEAERLRTVFALNAVGDDGLAAFIHAEANTGVLEAITTRLLPLLPVRAQQAIDITIRAVHDRDGRSYSDEANEVLDVLVATSSHPALQAWALALVNHGTSETKPAPHVGYKLLSSWAARHALVDEVGLALVERLRRLFSAESRHGMKGVLEVLATQPWSEAVTTSFVDFARTWLPTLPSEGAFDTALHFDELNGQAALCVGAVLHGAPHEVRHEFARLLLPMATTTSTRWMRKTRVQGALGVAMLDPTVFNEDVFVGLLAHMEQFNSDEEGSDALLAIALAAAAASTQTQASWAERLQALKISDRDLELLALRTVALFALQTKSVDDVEGALVRLCTASAYKEEYRQKRHQLTRRVLRTFPALTTTPVLETLAASSHEEVAAWARTLLPTCATPVVKRITWIDVERASDEERLALLADVTVLGRQHAARALVPAKRDDDAPAIRSALEAAVRACAEAIVPVVPPPSSYFAGQAPIPGFPAPLPPPGVPRELTRDEDRLLTEGVWALLRLPLMPSTVALCAELLLHHNRGVKDPVLRDPPDDIGLEAGMRQVVAENYGWQASTAKEWLQAHGLTVADEA